MPLQARERVSTRGVAQPHERLLRGPFAARAGSRACCPEALGLLSRSPAHASPSLHTHAAHSRPPWATHIFSRTMPFEWEVPANGFFHSEPRLERQYSLSAHRSSRRSVRSLRPAPRPRVLLVASQGRRGRCTASQWVATTPGKQTTQRSATAARPYGAGGETAAGTHPMVQAAGIQEGCAVTSAGGASASLTARMCGALHYRQAGSRCRHCVVSQVPGTRPLRTRRTERQVSDTRRPMRGTQLPASGGGLATFRRSSAAQASMPCR